MATTTLAFRIKHSGIIEEDGYLNGSSLLNAANWSQAQWKMQREKGDNDVSTTK